MQPDRPDELDRIENSGGKVINWNGQRVLGVLATSRSIGTIEDSAYCTCRSFLILIFVEDFTEIDMTYQIIIPSDGKFTTKEFGFHDTVPTLRFFLRFLIS